MTDQLSINFARTHARRDDPSTSHEAASSMSETSSAHCKAILSILAEHGPQTAEQVSQRCDLDTVQICRRLPDLERMERARPTGKKRKISTGRSARVWEAL